MTQRQEDISQAAHDNYPHETWIFIDGAMWADQNPSAETINKIISIYKKWYSEQSDSSMIDYIQKYYKNESIK